MVTGYEPTLIAVTVCKVTSYGPKTVVTMCKVTGYEPTLIAVTVCKVTSYGPTLIALTVW